MRNQDILKDYPSRQKPRRNFTADELKALQEDGVVCARSLLDMGTIEVLREAIEDAIVRISALAGESAKIDDGFSGDVFVWKLHDSFRDLALFSSLPDLAQQVLRTERVNFFYEQFFVKRAGSPVRTPWHQDIPFWPVQGNDLVSFWITLDPVTRESSGLEFVRGSHRWPERFKAISPGEDPYLADSDMPRPPTDAELRADHEILGWDMEPGDVLVFGSSVLHGSGGNASNQNDRRALAFRYTGPDVTYAPRPATMPLLWPHGLSKGDPLGGPLFPQVWPAVIKEEIAARMAGPEFPDRGMVEDFQKTLSDAGYGADSDKPSLFAG
jgi:ectoine hydroxylase-related dioxygenase (phytanoyl-CoA dioxygenase family)